MRQGGDRAATGRDPCAPSSKVRRPPGRPIPAPERPTRGAAAWESHRIVGACAQGSTLEQNAVAPGWPAASRRQLPLLMAARSRTGSRRRVKLDRHSRVRGEARGNHEHLRRNRPNRRQRRWTATYLPEPHLRTPRAATGRLLHEGSRGCRDPGRARDDRHGVRPVFVDT
jgi:hypothetical protein